MEQEALEKLKYPIGKYAKPVEFTTELRQIFIETIANFPQNIKELTSQLTDSQLDTPYRPEGWTVRQLIHHCADSHMNAFIRFKLSLTEDKPTVKAYEEQLWAEQPDYFMPIDASLLIIDGLHKRWFTVLTNMTNQNFEAEYTHPQTGNKQNLNFMLGLYDWHCNHHLAHISQLKKQMGW